MELKTFVKKSLIEICDGVNEARLELFDKFHNAPIAPTKMEDKPVWSETSIDFDIAVTVSVESSKNASVNAKSEGIIKIVAANIGANGTVGNSATNEQCNRIKFSIPFYPAACNKRDPSKIKH